MSPLEGIGHDLRELTGNDTEIRLKPRAGPCMGEDMHVVSFNSDLFDFYIKFLGVALVYEVKRGKGGGMTEASWKRADVYFENDVMGISRRERPPAAPVTGFS